MRKLLGLEKLTIRKICILGMLTALTVVLAIYCTFRIGNSIKIPFKFVTVFITAVMFGPVWGGAVGALGDILNSLLVPVGPPLPQITAVEFIYGFVFGTFYYKQNSNYYIRTVLCALILTIIDITLVSYLLTGVGYFTDFYTAVTLRFAAALIKCAMYIIVCIALKKHLPLFGRLMIK